MGPNHIGTVSFAAPELIQALPDRLLGPVVRRLVITPPGRCPVGEVLLGNPAAWIVVGVEVPLAVAQALGSGRSNEAVELRDASRIEGISGSTEGVGGTITTKSTSLRFISTRAGGKAFESGPLEDVYIISDPYYLSEPLVKTNGFRLTLNGRMDPYPCEAVIEVVREKGVVPSNLPWANKASEEFAAKHGLPVEAASGGAETALPEFADKMKTMKVPAPPPAAR